MKKLSVLVISLVLLATAGLSSALAEATVSGDAYVAVNSKYLWRGFDLSHDSSYVVQPGMDLSLGGFTASFWSNWDEDSSELNETDITLDYSFDVNKLVSMSVGNIYYGLDGAKDTNELYVGAAFNTLLSPEIKVYYDYDEADKTGLFLTASVGHSIDLSDGVALNLGALVSYNGKSDYAVGDYSNFHNAEFSASVDWQAMKGLTVSPGVIYSVPLSGDARDVIDNEFMAGVTVAYSF